MNLQTFSGKYHKSSEPVTGVLLVELNRAPVNAFNDDMWKEFETIIDRVSMSRDVRAMVLASAFDKYFTAGLDLNAQDLGNSQGLDPARKAFQLHQHILDFQRAISSLSRCRQPVIVALAGVCLGLAIDIASACDIRLASSDATFSIAEVNVGLAADIGTLQRFPRITGNDSLSRELALTGRKFSAVEAKDVGFVSRVIPGGRKDVVKAAVKLAGEIARKSPVAVVSTKHLMNHARDHTIQEGLEYTAAWNMAMLQSTDTTTAITATLRKQQPTFPPLSGSTKAKL